MLRSIVTLAAMGLGLAVVNDAAAQTSATPGASSAQTRFFNPFTLRAGRFSMNRFGLPQARGVLTAKPSTPTPVVSAAATSSALKVAKDDGSGDEIPQSVVTRPPFRPPVRSPYRPPPRPPF